MIKIISVVSFSEPLNLSPGGSLSVIHSYDEDGVPKTYTVASHECEELATWTHSILFRLHGELQWMVGTQTTIDWLESQV